MEGAGGRVIPGNNAAAPASVPGGAEEETMMTGLQPHPMSWDTRRQLVRDIRTLRAVGGHLLALGLVGAFFTLAWCVLSLLTALLSSQAW